MLQLSSAQQPTALVATWFTHQSAIFTAAPSCVRVIIVVGEVGEHQIIIVKSSNSLGGWRGLPEEAPDDLVSFVCQQLPNPSVSYIQPISQLMSYQFWLGIKLVS